MSTIFHKIISGEIKADIVFENDVVLAFRDINPVAPVHVLVIPKFYIQSLRQCHEKDALDIGLFMQGVSSVAKTLGLDADGYRVVFNSGKLAKQSVDYIHAHILAGRELEWPPG